MFAKLGKVLGRNKGSLKIGSIDDSNKRIKDQNGLDASALKSSSKSKIENHRNDTKTISNSANSFKTSSIGSYSSSSSSNLSSSSLVRTSQPLFINHNNSPDEAVSVQERLEGQMNLQIQIKHLDDKEINLTIERKVPIYDVLVTVANQFRFNPSDFYLRINIDDQDSSLLLKQKWKSNPVGFLNTNKIFIVPKRKESMKRDDYFHHQQLPKGLPFKPTVRFQVNLPHNQLMVMRIVPSLSFEEIKKKICQEKSFDPNRYVLVKSFKSGQSLLLLDLDKNPEYYGINDCTILSLRAYNESTKQFSVNSHFQQHHFSSLNIDDQNDPHSNRLNVQNDWSQSTPNIALKRQQSDSCSLVSSSRLSNLKINYRKKSRAPLPPRYSSSISCAKSIQNLAVISDENETDVNNSTMINSQTSSETFALHNSSNENTAEKVLISVSAKQNLQLERHQTIDNERQVRRNRLSRQNSGSDSSGYHEMLSSGDTDTPTESNSPAPPVSPNSPSLDSDISSIEPCNNLPQPGLGLVNETVVSKEYAKQSLNLHTRPPKIVCHQSTKINQRSKKRRAPSPPSCSKNPQVSKQLIMEENKEENSSLPSDLAQNIVPETIAQETSVKETKVNDHRDSNSTSIRSIESVDANQTSSENNVHSITSDQNLIVTNQNLHRLECESQTESNQTENVISIRNDSRCSQTSKQECLDPVQCNIDIDSNENVCEESSTPIVSNDSIDDQQTMEIRFDYENLIVSQQSFCPTETTEMVTIDNDQSDYESTKSHCSEKNDENFIDDEVKFDEKERNETESILEHLNQIIHAKQRHWFSLLDGDLEDVSITTIQIENEDSECYLNRIESNTIDPEINQNSFVAISNNHHKQIEEERKSLTIQEDQSDNESIPSDLEVSNRPDHHHIDNEIDDEIDSEMKKNSRKNSETIVIVSEWNQRQQSQQQQKSSINDSSEISSSINLDDNNNGIEIITKPTTISKTKISTINNNNRNCCNDDEDFCNDRNSPTDSMIVIRMENKTKSANVSCLEEKRLAKQVEIALNDLNETLDQCSLNVIDREEIESKNRNFSYHNNDDDQNVHQDQCEEISRLTSSSTPSSSSASSSPSKMIETQSSSTKIINRISSPKNNLISSNSFSVRDGIRKFNTINENDVAKQNLSSLRTRPLSNVFRRSSSSKLSLSCNETDYGPKPSRKLANFQIGTFKSESSTNLYERSNSVDSFSPSPPPPPPARFSSKTKSIEKGQSFGENDGRSKPNNSTVIVARSVIESIDKMIDGLDDEVQSNSRSSTLSKQSEDIQAQNNEAVEKLSTTNVSVEILDKNNSKKDHGEGYVSKNQNQIIKTSSFARKLNGILPSSNRNGPNFLDELKSKSQTWSHRNLSNIVAEQKAVNQDQIDGSISIENLNITSKIQDLPSKEKILNQPLPPPPLPSSSLFNSLKSITISEKESVRKTQTLLAPKGWYKTDDRNGESLSSTSTIHQRDALLDEIKTFQTKSKLRKVNVNKPFSLQIN